MAGWSGAAAGRRSRQWCRVFADFHLTQSRVEGKALMSGSVQESRDGIFWQRKSRSSVAKLSQASVPGWRKADAQDLKVGVASLSSEFRFFGSDRLRVVSFQLEMEQGMQARRASPNTMRRSRAHTPKCSGKPGYGFSCTLRNHLRIHPASMRSGAASPISTSGWIRVPLPSVSRACHIAPSRRGCAGLAESEHWQDGGYDRKERSPD